MRRAQPLHILQVIPEMTLNLGGPLISAINLGYGLKKNGHRVSYLTIKANLDGQTRGRFGLDSDAVTQLKCNVNRFVIAKADRALIFDLVQTADIVHLHGVWEALIYECLRACIANRIPAVLSPCGMLDRWSLAQKKLKKNIYLRLRGKTILAGPSLIHAASKIERLEIEHLGVDSKKIIETALATTPMPDEGRLRSSAGHQPVQIGSAFHILFLGRLLPTKGVELLMRAFAGLAGRVSDDVKLIITGPGSTQYLRRLDELTKELGIADQTRINPPVAGFAVYEVLQNADLFVLPSQHENFGLSIIESLHAGTPVVISDKTGVSDLVFNSKVGGVCTLEVANISSTIEQWYRKKRDETGLSKRCSDFVKFEFSPEILSKTWSDTYRSLVAEKSSGG